MNAREVVLRRRSLRLEHATTAWNSIETAVAVGAGLTAESIALVGFGFGFDSLIEVVAASVVVWQFRAEPRGRIDDARESKCCESSR